MTITPRKNFFTEYVCMFDGLSITEYSFLCQKYYVCLLKAFKKKHCATRGANQLFV